MKPIAYYNENDNKREIAKMKIKNVLSVSGGKDSTAMLLLAIERGIEFDAVFCDTGNEHEETYRYIEYLSDSVHPIKTIKADFSRQIAVRRKNLRALWGADGVSDERIESALRLLKPTGVPFLDLCLLKGRFPSTRARFCSEELKHVPVRKFSHEPLMDAGFAVVSWQGVRADESAARSGLSIVDQPEAELINYRPLILWSASDVFDMHRRHGVKWNPLYEKGMGRVGCMPCIHARKNEIREIANRYPDEIDRILRWETLVSDTSKRGLSSFFPADKTPGSYTNDKDVSIKAVVGWSRTKHGGKELDPTADDEPPMCGSLYGLCE
jgi:3'-phosphoadenosine 5'-phosphosulfate sulfotransferase (PAPS reductase)/FAD synthetase